MANKSSLTEHRAARLAVLCFYFLHTLQILWFVENMVWREFLTWISVYNLTISPLFYISFQHHDYFIHKNKGFHSVGIPIFEDHQQDEKRWVIQPYSVLCFSPSCPCSTISRPLWDCQGYAGLLLPAERQDVQFCFMRRILMPCFCGCTVRSSEHDPLNGSLSIAHSNLSHPFFSSARTGLTFAELHLLHPFFPVLFPSSCIQQHWN